MLTHYEKSHLDWMKLFSYQSYYNNLFLAIYPTKLCKYYVFKLCFEVNICSYKLYHMIYCHQRGWRWCCLRSTVIANPFKMFSSLKLLWNGGMIFVFLIGSAMSYTLHWRIWNYSRSVYVIHCLFYSLSGTPALVNTSVGKVSTSFVHIIKYIRRSINTVSGTANIGRSFCYFSVKKNLKET